MKKSRALKVTFCGLFCAMMVVCSWITIPSAVPFTLQTLGIFLAYFILGARPATVSLVTYLLLGAVGVPVFSGFKGGAGVLFSQTDGYLWGFLVGGVITIFLEKTIKSRRIFRYASGATLLATAYISGSLWYVFAYGEGMDFFAVLKICVLPFVIFDVLKLFLAIYITKRVKIIDFNK